MNNTADIATATSIGTGGSRLDDVREKPAFLIALAFMIVAATAANVIGARRVAAKKRREIGLKEFPLATEFLSAADAARFPLTGSCVLFGLYVAFRYLPREWINLILSSYLALLSVLALGTAAKPVIGASLFTGVACVAVGGWYLATNNWISNDILAFGICVAGVEAIPIKSFKASAILLCGLFLYDIFWVFGTDVMVTVAKGVQGPIKLLFPQDIFGDHEKKSLLGLGDIVIPGFFLMQMVRFSLIRSKGQSTRYFVYTIVAYVLSLLNTMVVMVVFDSAQPALLYIVPWLLLTALGAALAHGEVAALLSFDEEDEDKLIIAQARQVCPERLAAAEAELKKQKELGFVGAVIDAGLGLFGQDHASLQAYAKSEHARLTRRSGK
jgi:minor histocompatibility antigen H13